VSEQAEMGKSHKRADGYDEAVAALAPLSVRERAACKSAEACDAGADEETEVVDREEASEVEAEALAVPINSFSASFSFSLCCFWNLPKLCSLIRVCSS